MWSEAENYDLALSFQEKAGCDEIWEKICQVTTACLICAANSLYMYTHVHFMSLFRCKGKIRQ